MMHEGFIARLQALRDQRQRVTFAELATQLDSSTAYTVALKTVAATGHPVHAWKLGGTTTVTRELFQTKQAYFGPLVEGEVVFAAESTTYPDLPVLAAEAEVALRLSRNWSHVVKGETLTPEQAFDAWTPALEFPYSSFTDLPEAGLTALLADRCAAGGLVLGTPRPWPTPSGFTLSIVIDGVAEESGSSRELLMHPAEAGLDFCSRASAMGIALRPGQWVSTGGITRCVPINPDGKVQLQLDGQTIFTLGKQTEPIP